jgi:hypothetical protein
MIASALPSGATFDFAQKIFWLSNDLRERLTKRPGNACGAGISGEAPSNFFK